jgi:hypothetical protein
LSNADIVDPSDGCDGPADVDPSVVQGLCCASLLDVKRPSGILETDTLDVRKIEQPPFDFWEFVDCCVGNFDQFGGALATGPDDFVVADDGIIIQFSS